MIKLTKCNILCALLFEIVFKVKTFLCKKYLLNEYDNNYYHPCEMISFRPQMYS